MNADFYLIWEMITLIKAIMNPLFVSTLKCWKLINKAIKTFSKKVIMHNKFFNYQDQPQNWEEINRHSLIIKELLMLIRNMFMHIFIEVDFILINYLGMLLQNLRRKEEALIDYQKAIDIDPHYAETYIMIGGY